MFGWIRRMYDSAYGAIDNTVRSWVHDLVNGLYGFLHMIFGDVGNAWSKLQESALNLWHGIEKFGRYVATAFHVLYKVLIPNIIRDYLKRIGQAFKFARDVFDYAVHQVKYLIHLIGTSIDALWQTVLRDVYRPLLKFITQAWHWITHEGSLVYYYITHPDKLIDLLWTHFLSKLEREAWRTGALLGRFFLALIVHNLRRFVVLLEDIIDAVL